MITSSKAFRKIVLKTERELKSGSLNGAFLILSEIDETFGPHATFKSPNLCKLVERIVQNRSGYLTFEATSRTKPRDRLEALLRVQRVRNQIRKQDEAPEMGADSSSKGGLRAQIRQARKLQQGGA